MANTATSAPPGVAEPGKRARRRHHPDPIAYTIPDAARRINADVSVVKRAIAEGLLEPHYYFGSGYARVLDADLEEFVRSQPSEKA
ncbi:MAG TPA: hypothetical protein DCP91_07360 [Eggerthellaceae bacterium]|nr:hypothetical protein [Eggerthellaceae bacterium]